MESLPQDSLRDILAFLNVRSLQRFGKLQKAPCLVLYCLLLLDVSIDFK
jgi:hypothetical protein